MLVSGYWILKGNYPYFIQHQVSSILLLMAQASALRVPIFVVKKKLSSNS